MSNLANTYDHQGQHSTAEVLLKQCFEKKKVVLGENHPDTLRTMNNLADNYDSQGKHSDAEVLYKQCLDKRKAVLGENHPETLNTKNSLTGVSKKSHAS
jgi:hypothetical protein